MNRNHVGATVVCCLSAIFVAACSQGGVVSGVDAGEPLGFTPSNVDLSGLELSTVGDFVVDNDECSINTDYNLASCGDGARVLGFKIATQSDGSRVAVYVARSMSILAGQNLTVAGSLPFVFIALDTITIAGTLNGNARTDVAIGGGQSQTTGDTRGGGAGGGGAGTATTAGGGGSYCGMGGVGGAETGSASVASAAYGTAQITPLIGGSSGGAGTGSAGSGGGAIQLIAGRSITIDVTGLIQVGGGGGGFGGISGQEANGGGCRRPGSARSGRRRLDARCNACRRRSGGHRTLLGRKRKRSGLGGRHRRHVHRGKQRRWRRWRRRPDSYQHAIRDREPRDSHDLACDVDALRDAGHDPSKNVSPLAAAGDSDETPRTEAMGNARRTGRGSSTSPADLNR